MKRAIFALLFVSFFSPCYARTITINTDGTGDYPTIQAAIDDVNDGDVIVLTPGTYTGNGNRDIDYLGKAITVRSTDPNDPNIVATTVIDCNGTESEPHRGFYFHFGEDANSILNGFTITNGYAAGPWPESYGGAILCVENSSPTVTNCVIIKNSAFRAPGIYYYGNCNPILSYCTFIENEGGACGFALGSQGDMTVIGCLFEGNSGSALAGTAYNLTVTQCSFRNNHTVFRGGALYSTTSNQTTVTQCHFQKNSAIFGGGALSFGSNFNLILKDCQFIENSAGPRLGAEAGAASIRVGPKGNATLTNCVFQGNTATGESATGGAICHAGGKVTLTNCTISGNTADWLGGGVYLKMGDNIINNSLIWANSAPRGQQIAWGQPVAPRGSCKSINLNYSDVQGGIEDIYKHPDDHHSSPELNWGSGCIDADPCFVDSGYWDPNDTPADANDDFWFDGDYHLSAGSPCINAGDPCHPYDPNETDLDGNPRIIDGRIDMGALEYLPPLEARLLIRPRTINRKSNQKNIMAWLSLPEGVTKDDIDSNVPLTLYPGQIEASRQFIFESKRRRRPHTNIIAFFKKSDLMNTVPENGQVQLEVVGKLNSGRYFFGKKTVRIINPPHRRRH